MFWFSKVSYITPLGNHFTFKICIPYSESTESEIVNCCAISQTVCTEFSCINSFIWDKMSFYNFIFQYYICINTIPYYTIWSGNISLSFNNITISLKGILAKFKINQKNIRSSSVFIAVNHLNHSIKRKKKKMYIKRKTVKI